jgi:hypothetical protein
MPETTNNEVPDTDRLTARADQGRPSKFGTSARPASEVRSEQAACETMG